jgi:hypothetical protein
MVFESLRERAQRGDERSAFLREALEGVARGGNARHTTVSLVGDYRSNRYADLNSAAAPPAGMSPSGPYRSGLRTPETNGSVDVVVRFEGAPPGTRVDMSSSGVVRSRTQVSHSMPQTQRGAC